MKIWDNITVGATIKEIDKLLAEGCRDNANMSPNPEMYHKYTADASTKQYALLKMLSGNESDAHLSADIHIHDLEFLPFRPLNCLQHDLRFFIENGLKVDGTGLSTSSAKGAKNAHTLVNHIGQILGAGQVNMSGGQSIPFINTFLAPYTEELDDAELKQVIQMLIFNINMSYVSRGGQAVFSSFNIDLEMPEFLKDTKALHARCKADAWTGLYYRDYEDEAKRVAHMIITVMLEGDGNGKPHLFPNLVFQVNDKVDWSEWEDLFRLSSKFALPYFNAPINGIYGLVMGCRTRLAINWTNDWEQDLLRTGNLAYVSLNLPKYALQATGKDSRTFYEILEENLNIASSVLIKRRKHGERCLNKLGHLKFLSQKGKDGESYYRINNTTLSFGIVGLYEAVEILIGAYQESTANNILTWINNKAENLTDSTGYRWSVIASPAESTAGRFGIENKRMFPTRANVNGTTGAYYYTNGTHLPVDENNLARKIRTEAQYHPKTQGGNILNIFMGESYGNAEALKSLTEKVFINTNVGFWTYSGIYSICKDCNQQYQGAVSQCINCSGNDIEIYDRVTGYVQKVSGWNDSKQAEFKDRYRY